jgi:predicted phage terminase large subunit-like protein
MMPVDVSPVEFRALLRADFYSFIERSFYELNPETEFLPNWHIEKIAEALEKCRSGETKRLIINVGPRSLKSHTASVAYPAYLLGHNPAAKIIAVSYGEDLAEDNARKCRAVIMSPWYQRLFPTRLTSARPAVNDFGTSRNGFRLSVSVGGPLTGRGGDFIIIDDPLKPDEALSDALRNRLNDWYDHTLLTRLDNKETGCIIVIMQRLHEDDLVGHLLERPGWKLLRFPAIAEEDETHTIMTPIGEYQFLRREGEALHPEQQSLASLEAMRDAMGEYNFAGQYQQAPAPLGGGMVKAEWFKPYSPAEKPPHFQMIIQSWDTANKPGELNDFSVCTTWGVNGKQIYLLHVFRKRMDYPALKRAIRDLADQFQPRVILIEDKASGTPLIQELTHEGVWAVKAYKTTMDKVMRMHSVCSAIENGFVHIPEKAEWLGPYLHELTTFPKSKYDDQADSTSQALDWQKQRFFVNRVTVQEMLV